MHTCIHTCTHIHRSHSSCKVQSAITRTRSGGQTLNFKKSPMSNKTIDGYRTWGTHPLQHIFISIHLYNQLIYHYPVSIRLLFRFSWIGKCKFMYNSELNCFALLILEQHVVINIHETSVLWSTWMVTQSLCNRCHVGLGPI